ncbi:MAG: DUF4234 domain-containing protein [Candidatus Heimdallarchaeota archaeon]
MPDIRKFGTIRKYRRVIFLSIITLGLYNLFYQWKIFEDLQGHFERGFHTESRSYPTQNNSITMLIFLFLFPLYPYYIKYQMLHQHIDTSNIISQENCLEGFSALLSFVFLCACTVGIYPIIMESRWQRAFNEHILAHEMSEPLR